VAMSFVPPVGEKYMQHTLVMVLFSLSYISMGQ